MYRKRTLWKNYAWIPKNFCTKVKYLCMNFWNIFTYYFILIILPWSSITKKMSTCGTSSIWCSLSDSFEYLDFPGQKTSPVSTISIHINKKQGFSCHICNTRLSGPELWASSSSSVEQFNNTLNYKTALLASSAFIYQCQINEQPRALIASSINEHAAGV